MRIGRRSWLFVATGIVGISVAGAMLLVGGSTQTPNSGGVAAPTVPTRSPSPTTSPTFAIGVYDPVTAGEVLPTGYRQLLARDQIRPVYDPVFTSAAQVDWPADSLVIGVADDETAKVYPVTHLNQREMVIDSLGDTPILVSW